MTCWRCARCGLVHPDTFDADCDACFGPVYPLDRPMRPIEQAEYITVIWANGPDSEAARACRGEGSWKDCPDCRGFGEQCTFDGYDWGLCEHCGGTGRVSARDAMPPKPNPDYTPAVRRVVAWDGGDGLVEDIEQAYLDAAVLIWEQPSASRTRACLRRHHLSNDECDAAHERLIQRLAAWLRHRDEKAGHHG